METADTTIVDPHAADDPTTVVAGQPVTTKTTPDVKVTEDGNIVEVGGKKYYNESAFHGERTKAQNYAKTLQQLEPLMPEFEQFLAQKKGGRNATVDRATRSAPEGDYNEDELTGYAITRGYYDQQNQPDLKRAKDDLDIMTAIADRRASRAVRPVAESSVQDRARANAERAFGQAFLDGDPIADPKYLKAVFDALPDNMKADEQTIPILQTLAAGLQALDERRQPGGGRRARSREPMFREGSGGSYDSAAGDSLDALDRAAARARGKSPDAWSKLQKSIGTGSATGGTILDEV